MRNRSVIDALMPRVRQAVLSATLLHPDRWWYAAELARHLCVRQSTLQRELVSLTEAGILRARREGRMIYYQADTESPVFEELRGLLLKTAGLIDVLREALAPLTGRIASAFVYGSIARREERSASDVDLLVIGDVTLGPLVAALRPAREQLAREINPKLYRPAEFAKRLVDGDHFLRNILTKPKLFVVGSADVLDQVAEREPRGARADKQGRARQSARHHPAVLERR